MESELIQTLAAIKDSIDAAAQPGFIDWLTIGISFVSIAVSSIAIWFAVQVPRKIADRQDKIALFEKRSGIHTKLRKHYALAQAISANEDECVLKDMLRLVLGISGFTSDEISSYVYDMDSDLNELSFLFSGIEEKDYIELADAIADYFSLYITDEEDLSTIEAEEIERRKEHYRKTVGDFYEKYKTTFINTLNLIAEN